MHSSMDFFFLTGASSQFIFLFFTFQKEYHSWVQEDRRNIVAILEDLPSVKPPPDHLCELLPRLQARYYSISSSPKVSFIRTRFMVCFQIWLTIAMSHLKMVHIC